MRLRRCFLAAVACAWVAGCGGTTSGPADASPETSVDADVTTPDLPPADGDVTPPNDDGVSPDRTPDPVADEAPEGTGGDESEAPDEATVGDEGEVPDGDDVAPDPTEGAPDTSPDEATTDGCNEPGCQACPDDGLACTQAHRDDETGACVTVIDVDSCVVGGACYFTLEPDPKNSCLFCNPALDAHAFTPSEGQPCDDGDPCTSGDTCGGDAQCHAGPPTNCDDHNPCTQDACDATGCTHAAIAGNCDDQNKCTTSDKCVAGVCKGATIACASDNNPCTDDTCDPATGCQHVNNTKACDDYDACTANDACQDGTCQGALIDCSDGNPCTADSCVHGLQGHCVNPFDKNAPCTDNDACTTGDHCVAGPPAHCLGTTISCDDKNDCTADSCDAVLGCINTPLDGGPCADDGNRCTVNPHCVTGTCTKSPRDCEDGNLCTIDFCDKNQGCMHPSTTGACDDKDACTVGETCGDSVNCGGGAVVNCDDHNPCTKDECNSVAGCIHTPVNGLCDDGNPCTQVDTCVAGLCLGTPKNCDDGDPCTDDACSANGNCVYTAHVGSCVAADKCIANGTCQAGKCLGQQADCDDGNDCTFDLCDPANGCYHPQKLGACDDHTVCTENDHCEGTKCVGTPKVCEDGDSCTENKCDPVGGCWYDGTFTGPCNDSNNCTRNDRCQEGQCAGDSVFVDPISKAAKLSFGLNGNPGQGLDVDGNVATCSPKGKCAAGIDNSLSALAWLFNPELTKAGNAGLLALMLEHEAPGPLTGPYTLELYWGQRVAGGCDPTGPGCEYRVFSTDVTSSCDPNWSWGNANVDSTRLTAGGKGYEAPFYVVFGALKIRLTMKWARIDANVTLTDGVITEGAGVLAGAIGKQAMVDAFNAIPADQYPPPYTKTLVLGYLDKYLAPDIDLNGDGKADAVSVGLPFALATGTIVGVL